MRKKGVIVLAILILIFVTYITVDCIRLRNSKTGTRPLITIGVEESENRITYKGLGYSVEYYIDIGQIVEINGITYIEQLGYGAEFKLFDRILIWYWGE